MTVGTKNLTGAGTGNDRNAVIKRNGLQISFTVKDADTGGSIPGVTPIPAVSKASGEAVDLAPGPAITGYELAGVVIEQGTPPTLTANLTPGADFGRVTGTMPNQDVAVSYEYRKIGSQIIFTATEEHRNRRHWWEQREIRSIHCFPPQHGMATYSRDGVR